MESYGSVSNRSTVVCAQLTIQQSVVELILSDMVQAKAQSADVVEVRLDHITDFQPRRDLQTILITNKPLPILIVYRPKWEGGLYDGDENTRLEALKLALELGADFIQVEFKEASQLTAIVEYKRNHNIHSIIIASCFVDGITHAGYRNRYHQTCHTCS